MTTAGSAFSALGTLIILGLIVAAIVWILAALRPGSRAAPAYGTSSAAPSPATNSPLARHDARPRDARLPDPPPIDEVSPRRSPPPPGSTRHDTEDA
ncbi:MAG: hypothetical protein ACR2KV_00660 [Solirubrobacteraceae bacterium]